MSCEGSAPGWLQARLDVMPPVRAMAVQVVSVTPDRVCLRAPLAANVNDKGCAFGGSIAGLMTLAGWGLLVTRAQALAGRKSVVCGTGRAGGVDYGGRGMSRQKNPIITVINED